MLFRSITQTIVVTKDKLIYEKDKYFDQQKYVYEKKLKASRRGKILPYVIAVVTTSISFFALTR